MSALRTVFPQHNRHFKTKQALKDLPHHELPLQQPLQQSSQVSDEPIQVMFLDAVEFIGYNKVRVGVFYSGIIAGCNCADDPTPVDTVSEYCTLELVIDRCSAEVEVLLIVMFYGCLRFPLSAE
ncbi:MAG: hypothetical protein P8179_24625 [Candidatus Thiodiazotropha sp.]